MSYFDNISLLKAPQAYDFPLAQYVSDLIEICNLAAVVEKDVESVSIPVDFCSPSAYADFERHLKTRPVDLVGISSMTGAFNNAMRLAEMAKRANKFVVLGGYHPSALPEDVLKSPFVDAVVIGEGEETFRDLVLNGPSEDVPGLAIKKNGGVVFTGTRPLIKDLDALPLPMRSARPVRFGEAGDAYSIDTVYTSRGCPYKCTFCANDLINQRWRARSPENIVEELTLLHDPKQKKLVKLWDANFLTNVKMIEKLCDLMIERELTNFRICFETSVDDVIRAEGIIPKLYKIGVHHVGMGIESPNVETLKLMKKKSRGDSCARAVEMLSRHRIKPQGFFIIGHYSETEEDTKKYPEYAESLGLRHALFMVMTPYPGTEIYGEYKEQGRIKSTNWDIYNNFGTTVETKSMDIKALKRMYAYCWGRFYTRYAFWANREPLAVASVMLYNLFMFLTILKTDKSNTEAEIKEYLFDFLKAGDRPVSRPIPYNSSLIFKLFKKITIRFIHSPGNNMDFRISQSNRVGYFEGEQTDDRRPVKGITFNLDKIINFTEKIPAERTVLIACKLDNVKKTPNKRIRNLLSLLKDRDMVSAGVVVGWFIFTQVIQGFFSSLLHSLPFQKTENA